jgi:transcriptional regulator with PAS, ATPase and Fis domain
VEYIRILGAGNTEITKLSIDEASATFAMDLTCAGSAEADAHYNEAGKSAIPVCWVLTGYLSGYASYCMKKNVYFTEAQCKGAGSPGCAFVGKDIDSWGSEFEHERSFFLATDMQKRIAALERRIHEQERALALHRRQMRTATAPSMLAGVEIRSKAFRNALELAARVASFDSSILLTGETGSGKEVVARHIHAISPRKNEPFIVVNCSALPETLLENELFGHKAGSFTGAKSDEAGLFEAASNGTIFLDEIGDISPAIQAKLLRVLQSKEIRPVGETHARQIDVRVIAATHRDLPRLVREGTFREDLLYRLRVVEIALPPLRDRKEDIVPLGRFFLDRLSRKMKMGPLRFAPETLDSLIGYPWPGNVREWENALENAAILCTGGIITPELLPISRLGCFGSESDRKEVQSIEDLTTSHIRTVLESAGQNRREAARLLKISESKLYRLIRTWQKNEAARNGSTTKKA